MASSPACSLPLKFDGVNATIFDVLFHILILSLILQLVYEFKFEKMSHNIMKAEVKTSLKDAFAVTLSDSNISVPNGLLKTMEAWYANDEDYNTINKLVVGRNRMAIGFILATTVGFFSTMAFSCKAKNNRTALFNVLANNTILLVVVGIIEAVFVLNVAMKYVPTKPSLLTTTIMDRLRNIDQPIDPECGMFEPCGSQLPLAYRVGGFAISLVLLVSFVGRYNPKTHGINFATVMWQGTMVAVIVSALFLTVGTTQEMLIARSTINRIVDNFAGTIYRAVKVADPGMAELIVEKLRTLEIQEDADADDRVEENNARLRVRALKIVASAFMMAILVSVAQRLIYKKLRERGLSKFVDESALHTMYAAIIGALCSFISEFNFLVNVAGLVRPISSNDVALEALSVLRADENHPKITSDTPSPDTGGANVTFGLVSADSPSPKNL